MQYLIGPSSSLNSGISILSEVTDDEIACELTDGGSPRSNAVGTVTDLVEVIKTQYTPATTWLSNSIPIIYRHINL